MASIYDIDFNLQSDNLDAPQRRLPKFEAFLHSLMAPLQWLHINVFTDYKLGSSYPVYDNLATYNFGDQVTGTDKRVYFALNDGLTGVMFTDPLNWIVVNSNFIGTDERVKYSAQKLLFEFALNRFFMVDALPADQIYITNNFVSSGNVFVMANDSQSSSVMPLNSVYQIDYIGLVPAYTADIYDYTINVPVAVYNALGTNATNREFSIRAFADLYNLAGMRYNVLSY